MGHQYERAVLADRPSEDFVAQQQQLDAPENGPDLRLRQEQRDLDLAAAYPILSTHWGLEADRPAVDWLGRRFQLRREIGRIVAVGAGLGGSRP
jgi:hypothetical protein